MTDSIDLRLGLDPDWREDALCRQVDPELFHPGGGGNAEAQQAKAICRRCPVIASCAAWVEVFEAEQPEYATDGIWAATSANTRRRLRRTAAAA